MSPITSPAADALQLAEETLRDLELGQVSLSSIAMRAGRIAGLMNDTDYETLFKYEVSGYPTTQSGVASEVGKLAEMANRHYTRIDPKTNETRSYAYLESIKSYVGLRQPGIYVPAPQKTYWLAQGG